MLRVFNIVIFCVIVATETNMIKPKFDTWMELSNSPFLFALLREHFRICNSQRVKNLVRQPHVLLALQEI